jgi:dienelactone hydrolase
MRRSARLLAALVVLTAVAVTGGVRAGTLPTVSVAGSPRPGPAILYAPEVTAPQLSNNSNWTAGSIMVSGAQAYRGGEYMYQDYVYDSFGANTTDLPLLPPDPVPNAGDVLFGGQTGDLVYPTDTAVYAHDAADLLEFRAKLADDGTVLYRVTLNTMIDVNAAAVAIGIDSGPGGTDDWGFGIGKVGALGLDQVVAASGNGAFGVAGATATADVAANQIEIAVPLTPAGAVWKHYLVVGLWDGTNFKAIADDATATTPGGARGTNPPPVFNAGFRFDEPAVNGDINGLIADPLGSTGTRTVGAGNWRDHAQAKALAARDISGFRADIDFSKIAAGTTDDSGIPTTGFITRLYVSALNLGEGAKVTRPMLLGKIQPYGLYVPTTYTSGTPAPMTLMLHSLSCSYNQYAVFAPLIYQQLGEELGTLMLTTEGRGPDGWYHDEAEVDLFEAWADVARSYDIDWDHVNVSGYSMGGYGTYRIASLYPDLFARAFAVVGPADESITGGPTGGQIAEFEDEWNNLHILDNMRHVPLLMWNGTNDELVPVAGVLQTEQRMYDLGYEHRLDLFPGYDHFLLSILDEWGPGKAWLGSAEVARDPARVTFKTLPETDAPALGLVHDHAYWVSNVVTAGARSGLVDAVSLAKPLVELPMHDVLPAGIEPAPHVQRGLTSVCPELMVCASSTPPAGSNGMKVSLEGVASLTLWPERAGITTGVPFTISVASSGSVTVVLAGSFPTQTINVPGVGTYTITL